MNTFPSRSHLHSQQHKHLWVDIFPKQPYSYHTAKSGQVIWTWSQRYVHLWEDWLRLTEIHLHWNSKNTAPDQCHCWVVNQNTGTFIVQSQKLGTQVQGCYTLACRAFVMFLIFVAIDISMCLSSSSITIPPITLGSTWKNITYHSSYLRNYWKRGRMFNWIAHLFLNWVQIKQKKKN